MPANITFLVAFLLLGSAATSAQTASSVRAGDLPRAERIVLRVHNYAHVDPKLLARSEKTTSA